VLQPFLARVSSIRRRNPARRTFFWPKGRAIYQNRRSFDETVVLLTKRTSLLQERSFFLSKERAFYRTGRSFGKKKELFGEMVDSSCNFSERGLSQSAARLLANRFEIIRAVSSHPNRCELRQLALRNQDAVPEFC
jgi:hypothetical protein